MNGLHTRLTVKVCFDQVLKRKLITECRLNKEIFSSS